MQYRALLVLSMSAALAAACGGGGGGSLAARPAPTAIIDGANAEAIAGSVVAGNLDLAAALGWSDDQLDGTQAAASVAGGLVIYRFRYGYQNLRPQPGAAGRSAPAAVVQPTIEDCTIAGTVTISGNVADENQLSAGDVINATFDDCDDGDGWIASGDLTLRIASISGDFAGGLFRVVAETTFSDLQLTDDSGSGTLNGDATLTVDTRTPTRASISLSADSLAFVRGTAVYQLTDYLLSADVLLATGGYTTSIDGQLGDSSAFAGTVDIATLQPLTGAAGDFPDGGRLRITGGGGVIEVEALDAVNVRLGIDADGNGVIDEVRDLAWAELVLAGASSQAVAISPANALAVARDVTGSSNAMARAATSMAAQLQAFAIKRVADSAPAGTISPQTSPCDVSGSVTVSGTLAATGFYTPGDLFDAEFADCIHQQALGALNGSVMIAITGFEGEGTSSAYVATTQTFADLTVTPASGTAFSDLPVTINGTASVAFDNRSVNPPQPGPLFNSINTADLHVSWGVESYRFTGWSSNSSLLFQQTGPSTYAPATVTLERDGIIESKPLGGAVVLSTPQAQVQAADSDPATGFHSGVLRITGAGNSAVNLVSIDDLDARLDIDADGNGLVESSQNVTWAQANTGL